jgi:hypothetical protein
MITYPTMLSYRLHCDTPSTGGSRAGDTRPGQGTDVRLWLAICACEDGRSDFVM